MTDAFKIDLRSLMDTERELIEAAMEKLAEAVALDTNPTDPEAMTRAYRDAGRLVRALQLMQARKPAKPRIKSGEKRNRNNGGAVESATEAATADAARRTESAAPAKPAVEPAPARPEVIIAPPAAQHEPWCATLQGIGGNGACDCRGDA